jgi:hypothetical protein
VIDQEKAHSSVESLVLDSDCPRGQTPTLKHQNNPEALYLQRFISFHPGITFYIQVIIIARHVPHED